MARSGFAWHAQVRRPPLEPDTTVLPLAASSPKTRSNSGAADRIFTRTSEVIRSTGMIRSGFAGYTNNPKQSSAATYYQNDQTGQTNQASAPGVGYSGYGYGLNDPESQSVGEADDPNNPGPIPQGQYTIGPAGSHTSSTGSNLPYSMRLTPSIELIQNGGQVMLQAWLELNRTDRRRALDDEQHRYAAQCEAPASGEDNTVTTVVTLRDKPTVQEIVGSCESSPCRHHLIVFIWGCDLTGERK